MFIHKWYIHIILAALCGHENQWTHCFGQQTLGRHCALIVFRRGWWKKGMLQLCASFPRQKKMRKSIPGWKRRVLRMSACWIRVKLQSHAICSKTQPRKPNTVAQWRYVVLRHPDSWERDGSPEVQLSAAQLLDSVDEIATQISGASPKEKPGKHVFGF